MSSPRTIPTDDQRLGTKPAKRSQPDEGAYLPTVGRIARETAKFRAGWTESTRRLRAGGGSAPWTAPQVKGGVS